MTGLTLTILYDIDEVILMTPNLGLATGGFDIVITLQKMIFTPHTCVFGSLSVPVTEGSNPMTITCRVPLHPVGVVEVTLITSFYHLSAGVFHFISRDESLSFESKVYETKMTSLSKIEPIIFFTWPTLIPYSGGAFVIVTGNRFIDSTRLFCRFGNYSVVAHFLSDSQVSCESPIIKGIRQNAIELKVTVDDSSYSRPVLLQIYTTPEILSVEPLHGYSYGRTIVTITFRYYKLLTGLKCRFGVYEVIAQFQDHSSVFCITPDADIHESVVISLAVDGVDDRDVRGGVTFTFLSSFHVISLHPRYGPKQGGTKVIIKVDDIDSRYGSPVCWFGSSQPVCSSPLDKNTIICVSPTFDGGSLHQPVYVLHDGMNPHDYDHFTVFTYVDEIIALDVSPPIGSVSGGTAVSIRIVPMRIVSPAVRCAFDTLLVAGVYVSESEVTCLTPPFDREAEVPVKVVLNDHAEAQSITVARFRYTSQAYLSDIFPGGGSSDGGTIVHLYGRSLPLELIPQLASCRFGHLHIVPAKSVSNREIICNAPPLAGISDSGLSVNVSVRFNGVDFVGCERFKYIPPLKVSYLSSRLGPVNGGALVHATLSCSDCTFVSDAECHFVPWTVQSHEISISLGSFTVTCISPNVTDALAEEVPFEISINGGNDKSTSERTFAFAQYPEVTGAFPRSSWARGGDEITIEGSGFDPKYDLTCFFGSSRRYICKSGIYCTKCMLSWVIYSIQGLHLL